MRPVLIRADNEDAFSSCTPVGSPTSERVALVRVAARTDLPAGNAGFWECTPGRFRRELAQAEYSFFISGEGSFTPDGGTPIEFCAGDIMYFHANTKGEWDIREPVKKSYLIMT